MGNLASQSGRRPGLGELITPSDGKPRTLQGVKKQGYTVGMGISTGLMDWELKNPAIEEDKRLRRKTGGFSFGRYDVSAQPQWSHSRFMMLCVWDR